MTTRISLVSILLILLVAALAYAQTPIVTANIPFAFTVENKTLPAGKYEFIPVDASRDMKILAADKKGEASFAPIITRLASGMHTTPEDSHVVFDKVGDVLTLSEIWPVGEDGYLLHATKGKHEHRVVNVPK